MVLRWKRNTAFTLIELIIVFAIVAILAAIVVAKAPGTKPNLNSVAQQLASDIRYTQSLAMSRAQSYQLILSSTSYQIQTSTGTVVPNETTGQTNFPMPTQPSYYAVTISLPPTNLPNNIISFNSSGTPYVDSAATVALSNAAVITLTSGTNTSTVTIQPQTGRVSVP